MHPSNSAECTLLLPSSAQEEQIAQGEFSIAFLAGVLQFHWHCVTLHPQQDSNGTSHLICNSCKSWGIQAIPGTVSLCIYTLQLFKLWKYLSYLEEPVAFEVHACQRLQHYDTVFGVSEPAAACMHPPMCLAYRPHSQYPPQFYR